MSVETKALLVLAGASALSLVALAVWYRFMGRKRLVEDLPTSKVAGVALGATELCGVVICDDPVVSPHGARDCAYWEQVVYEEQTDSDGDRRWKEVERRSGGRKQFHLEDETGSIRVWTRDAEMKLPLEYDGPMSTRSASLGDGVLAVALAARGGYSRRRVKEYVLPVGAEVYVLGHAALPDDATRPEIGPDPDRRHPFLVWVGGEGRVVGAQRLAAYGAGIVAVVAAAVAGIAWIDGARLLEAETLQPSTITPGPPLAMAGLALWVMAFAMLGFTYNGLVRLRNRVQRSWSLLGVELQRRHDLVPALVEVVARHGEVERRFHTELAALRAGAAIELPERPTDAAVVETDAEIQRQGRKIRGLLALVERYPELRADEAYRRLQAQLTATEDRIALARSFYNDSVMHLHDRAGGLPGRPVAWIFDLDLEAAFTSGSDSGPVTGPRERPSLAAHR